MNVGSDPIQAAVPSLGDYVRSYYRGETVLSKVKLAKVLEEAYEMTAAAIAAQLFIQNQQGRREGLSAISTLQDYSSVTSNDNGIQSGGKLPLNKEESPPYLDLPLHETTSYTPFDRLLRIPLRERMSAIGQSFGIIVPHLSSVHYIDAEVGNEEMPVDQIYFPLLETIPCLSEEETIEIFKGLSPDSRQQFARSLCRFILECGIADATFTQIRLQKDDKDQDNALYRLVFFPPFPYQLLVAKEDVESGLEPLSVEQCGRIGLARFAQEAEKNGLPEMAQIARDLRSESLRTYSITRIVLSILCPLIPLVLLVISAIRVWSIQKKLDAIRYTIDWSESNPGFQITPHFRQVIELTHTIPRSV